MRILFLFNHDQTHQIAHSLPIALALMDTGAPVEVVLASTNSRLSAEIERLGGQAIGGVLPLIQLGLHSPVSTGLAKAFGALLPSQKLLVYRDNLDFFRGFDMLVVAEKTSLILKSRYGLNSLRIVHTRHGAGDRAIGFDKASAAFDHVLVSGAKIQERLIAETGLDPDRISVVGYPKFDVAAASPERRLFGNDRPTVLYNPHSSPHLSSWYTMGRKVLDFFAGSDRFNLIFAPHVMLFERRFNVSIDPLRIARPGRIADRYRRAANVHIDLGSAASTDMTYTNAADIYLGDVSSQIYEFLGNPRPCVFLNAHGIDHEGDPNFAHWRAGPVIGDARHLGRGLERAILGQQKTYRPIQEALFARSFDLDGRPSAERAAEVILAILGIAKRGRPTMSLARHG